VLEAVQQVRQIVDLGKGRTMTATQLCERFGFVGNAQWTPVGELSGGERRRLQLLRLLMDEPNVLVLDEPTNDLDIDTLTALEDLLDGWPGTLLVVSHDRYFVERVCDREVALLGDGTLRDLPGGVEEYLKLRRAQTARRLVPAPSTADGGGDDVPPDAATTPDAAATRSARKELARLERTMERLRDREVKLHAELEAAATDHEKVFVLDASLRALHEERATLEHRWLELAEQLG
jgi:ATP-binding cassette subfamily F protein uup